MVRETPTETSEAWNNVVKSGRDTIDTLHTSLLRLSGVQNDEQLLKKVTDQARDVGTGLQTQITALAAEAGKNTGKFDGVVKELTDKLTEVAADLKKNAPDTTKLQVSVALLRF